MLPTRYETCGHATANIRTTSIRWWQRLVVENSSRCAAQIGGIRASMATYAENEGRRNCSAGGRPASVVLLREGIPIHARIATLISRRRDLTFQRLPDFGDRRLRFHHLHQHPRTIARSNWVRILTEVCPS